MVEALQRAPVRRPLWHAVALALMPLCLVLAIGIAAAAGSARQVHQDLQRLLEESRESALARSLSYDLAGCQRWLALADDATGPPAEVVQGDLRHHLRGALTAMQRFAVDDDPSSAVHQTEEAQLLHQIADACQQLQALLEQGAAVAELRAPLERAARDAALLSSRIDQEALELGQDANERTDHLRQLLLVLGAASVLTCVWLLFLLRRRVLRPVAALQSATVALTRGADVDVPQGVDDELGRLGSLFALMAQKLRAHHNELEQRVAERSREVLRSAQLAELGSLAAGIAHEINNPLASIAACAEGLQRELQREGRLDPDGLREYLAIVHREAMRAKDITAGLLHLARQDQPQQQLFWLGHELNGIAQLFTHQFAKKGVALQIEACGPTAGRAAGQGPAVRGCAAEFRQVLLNLLRNALDASPAGTAVSVRCGALADAAIAWLEVADQGPGIPSELRDRVFEPFFTTKPPGQGTGLGLAITHRIVTSHGGRLSVQDRSEGGACFRVELPLASNVG